MTELCKFFGQGKSSDEYDALALTFINEGLLQQEAALFNSKWFDYRFMHPTEATYQFAHCYRIAYREMTRQNTDIDRSEYVRGFKADDIMTTECKEVVGFWKARQSADRLGIPYLFYAREAMKYASNMLWANIPRPKQMYSEKFIDHIRSTWESELSSRIVEPDNEIFKSCDYSNDVVNQFRDWLCQQIKNRSNQIICLGHHIFGSCLLTESFASKRFDESMLRLARDDYFA